MLSEELVEGITAQFRERVQQVLVWSKQWEDGKWLQQGGRVVQKEMQQIGCALLEGLIEQQRGGHVGPYHQDEQGPATEVQGVSPAERGDGAGAGAVSACPV